ncbi:hypothetical protein FACS1894172_12780 [Spirochaetia bacterium]|nr:hypothetical protein FACS1894164_19070 [Spirochaetia bacterium]GHU33715.1 hypothetical protein FACS1894172_12780 [Spirochaetia bacterium]
MPKMITVMLFVCLSGILSAQEMLRGEVNITLEPIYGTTVDPDYPLTREQANRRALDEAAFFFSGIIYGWMFEYSVGERARGIVEYLEITPEGSIPWGDPGLTVTDTRVYQMHQYVWAEYRLTPEQKSRMNLIRSSGSRTVQATGHAPLEGTDWPSIRQTVLEDAAKQAIRNALRGDFWNRPEGSRGYISLEAFPRYWIDSGLWSASARFRVSFTEIIPFGAY